MTSSATETTFTSPRLERPHDAPLAGVCLALARTTGTDVVLWRVLFVVLTVFGGLGVALYLACYVTIPAQAQEHSLVSRLLHGPDRTVTTKQVLLLALVLVVAAAALHDNGGAVVVAGLAGLGLLWWRRRHPSPVPALISSTPSPPPVSWTGVGDSPVEGAERGVEPDSRPGQGGGSEDTAAVLPPYQAPYPPYQAPAWTPPPPRPRSVITPLTLSVGALVVGALLLVAAAGSVSIPTEVVLAVALGVVGLGLVASAFVGRARGLVPVALLLALALGATAAVRPGLDHGVGTRRWDVTTVGSTYELGIGEGRLVLGKALSAGDDGRQTNAKVVIGHLLIEVPAGVHVIVDARVKNGDIRVAGADTNGHDVRKTVDLGPREVSPVHIRARVSYGMVEVRSA